MIFESLAEKLQKTLGKLKGKGKLSEKDVNNAMREVKLALLEADVNFKVVKKFINNVKERAVGHEVMESLTPGQQVIKIVNEELTKLMGETQSKIEFASSPPTIIMLCGLQGAGKTTTSGKLAGLFKKNGKTPLLVACDIYRPAAIKQLQVVGSSIGIPVFSMGDKQNPVNIAKAAIEYGKKNGNDVIIIDTAGRLHIDEDLMNELENIKDEVKPHEILLVVDAMTGQDAVTVAETFDNRLGIDGVILTKLDGDARGGAALSIRAVTQKPIKFVCMGEKLEQIEPFHPDRMASRILGMGDVLSLIEKAQASLDAKKAIELEKKLRNQQFTFEDFLEQLQQMKNLGPLDQILEMIPGMGSKQLKNLKVDEKELVKIEAIIQSMTKEERQNPSIIDGSRRKRIAKGSGTSIQDVNRLLKQFKETKKMIKKMGEMEKAMKKGKFKIPFFR
ncbi:signal recognition particle protein [Caloranaerobacter azorensis]|uniref:Signal recognition particle protein n=3 Tax=Caloranaerobacter azorensis TaxID=116090 RepID=A0A1M5RNY1_9FIRM|nr:signal recognition particle protein [Caloranaerobacter azorensis]KGG80779.1 signal recognition particle [Caloranaerobacter azorensis H53214]QIB26220.1 signal recognition particle protein [Caloranaerobacter azorensis]SHH28005.1 signal recognition particle subunit FFH/SRP54 (srp54) [Caloranaerobacter azorensis DSM 13643]